MEKIKEDCWWLSGNKEQTYMKCFMDELELLEDSRDIYEAKQ